MASTGKRARDRSGRWAEHQRLLALGTDEHYEDVDLYDFEYVDHTEDVVYYEGLVESEAVGREGFRVLELGAGSGRVTLPLALRGHSIAALDRSPTMLASLRARVEAAGAADRVEITEGDMTDLPFDDESFDVVISPFNAMMHLYGWADLRDCFSEAHRVLRPGGAFGFDVLLPDLEWLGWDPAKRHAAEKFVHPTTGETMTYSTNHTYDPETQVCHIRIYYDHGPRPRPRKEPARLVHLAHRQIFPEEVRVLSAWTDFVIESHDGDFAGLGLTNDVESQVVLCRKPGRRRPLPASAPN